MATATPKMKRRKFETMIRSTARRAIKRAFRDRKQAANPGKGWTYKLEGTKLILEMDITQKPWLSKSGTSMAYATTSGYYELTCIGLDGWYAIAHIMRALPSDYGTDKEVLQKMIEADKKIQKEREEDRRKYAKRKALCDKM